MKASPVEILLNANFKLDKKYYLISGNETSLIEKIKDILIYKHKDLHSASVKIIEDLDSLNTNIGLFEENIVFVYKNKKKIDKDFFDKIEAVNNNFIFVIENSPKIKKLKSFFNNNKNAIVIDCYELDKGSKTKIINNFIKNNNIGVDEDVFWFLVERMDNRYFFLENELKKLKQLDQKNISLQDCKKILTFDTNNKAGIFFYILKKNNQIINIYRNKIISNEDANEFYFYCKSYCALILNSKDESDFIKAVPKYLFREKSIFLEIFKKYNQKKRAELIRLIGLTDKNIRLRSSFTKMLVIRFVLNLRKITIS